MVFVCLSILLVVIFYPKNITRKRIYLNTNEQLQKLNIFINMKRVKFRVDLHLSYFFPLFKKLERVTDESFNVTFKIRISITFS